MHFVHVSVHQQKTSSIWPLEIVAFRWIIYRTMPEASPFIMRVHVQYVALAPCINHHNFSRVTGIAVSQVIGKRLLQCPLYSESMVLRNDRKDKRLRLPHCKEQLRTKIPIPVELADGIPGWCFLRIYNNV